MMNKMFVLLSMCALSFTVFADKVAVYVEPTGDMGTRKDVPIPEVDYDSEENSLGVTFDSDEFYEISVEDYNGNTKFSHPLNVNGAKIYYKLPSLQNGTYILKIESHSASFEGDFDVEE